MSLVSQNKDPFHSYRDREREHVKLGIHQCEKKLSPFTFGRWGCASQAKWKGSQTSQSHVHNSFYFEKPAKTCIQHPQLSIYKHHLHFVLPFGPIFNFFL